MLGRSLINYRTVRAMATAQSSGGKLASAMSPEKIGQILKTVATSKFTKAALVELRPPTPMEIPAAIRDGIGIFRTRWRDLTVREAWLNFLVTTEVVCWFFVGECIGKGNLIGYQV